VSFNNSGSVNVQAGTLGLDSGGSQDNDFTVATGATLRLSGTHSFTAGSAMSGAGNLAVIGGTISEAGAVNLTGTKTFTAGTATFNGAFTGGSFLTINGGVVSFNTSVTFAAGSFSSGLLS